MGSETLEKATNYDELIMQHGLLFADSLKDLKNLRVQLYSAAEYFEQSYSKDDQKQLVVESSKDYVTKALISTVDHLGSVADKLNHFLDEKANEFSSTRLRLSCIEQRLQTCQRFINLSGISQQSLVLKTPKHHKQYIIPGETLYYGESKSMYSSCIAYPQDSHQSKQENYCARTSQVTKGKLNPLLLRKEDHRLPSRDSSLITRAFTFTMIMPNKELGKRSVSPLRLALKRSGSVFNRSSSPAPTTSKHRSPSEPRRAISMCIKRPVDKEREMELYTKRSKHLLKALLSIHRSRKDNIHNKFRD